MAKLNAFGLLVVLGLSQEACGGTALSAADGDGGSSSASGALNAQGGFRTTAGGASSNWSSAGRESPGGTSYGGTSSIGPSPGGTSYGGNHPTAMVPHAGTAGVLCAAPEYNARTGFVGCENGPMHRPAAIVCPYQPVLADAGASGFDEGASVGDAGASGEPCVSNLDCTGLAYGWCDDRSPPYGSSQCKAGCREDSDCGPHGLCECDPGTPAGRCVYAANCKVDADCGANSLCVEAGNDCSYPNFQCSFGVDECRVGADDCAKGSCLTTSLGINVCHTDVCQPSP